MFQTPKENSGCDTQRLKRNPKTLQQILLPDKGSWVAHPNPKKKTGLARLKPEEYVVRQT